METFEYDGEIAYDNGSGWLVCENKNIKILKSKVLEFVKAKLPIGHKVTVGLTIDEERAKELQQERYVYIWRDEKYTHIGCLKETTDTFNRKYIQLVKNLKK